MTSALEQDPAFDYRTAPLSSILARASLLRGHVLGDIVGARFTAAEPRRGKHEVGAAIEHFFGIPSNSRSEADFSGARIELKVVPLVRVGSELRVKERTVISMIDYEELILERWDRATVRKKLNILFIFFEHIAGLSKAQFPTSLLVVHWQPDHTVEGFIEADWQRVRRKIRLGLADELSESDGDDPGPVQKRRRCTVDEKATFQFHARQVSGVCAQALVHSRRLPTKLPASRQASPSIDNGVVSLTSGFEEQLLQRFHPFEGDEVGAVAERLGIPPSNAKSFAARVLRRMFGARDFQIRNRRVH